MIIHFICTGNVYRSRLAEAYLNSKNIRGVKAISSGIKAREVTHGYIAWYAQRLIEKENLIEFSKPMWTQTTFDIYKKSDIVIFITRINFNRCIKIFKVIPNYYEIWNISDLDDLGYFIEMNSPEEEMKKIELTEEAYSKMKQKTDNLLLRIKQGKIFPLDNYNKMIHK